MRRTCYKENLIYKYIYIYIYISDSLLLWQQRFLFQKLFSNLYNKTNLNDIERIRIKPRAFCKFKRLKGIKAIFYPRLFLSIQIDVNYILFS